MRGAETWAESLSRGSMPGAMCNILTWLSIIGVGSKSWLGGGGLLFYH